ncbi:MAG: pirin family protein [Bacteroidetes bacterium]|nr:pirin family protein [Bacteroidota bacterium]
MRAVKAVKQLGFPWETQDPFLFCVYHADDYPRGNENFGPDATLDGRSIGNDFVLKDGWRMYHGERVPGFPVHPHRGFETVTVVRKGVVDHSDSLGGAGRYGKGDVQWMTAGKGVQHAEMFPLLNREKRNPLELFQIWLNLPRADKFAEPHYAMLWSEHIPVIEELDHKGLKTMIEVVAGFIGTVKAPDPAPDSWAASGDHKVAIWVVEMEPGAKWTLPVAGQGINRSLYFFEGDSFKLNGDSFGQHCALELEAHFDVHIENGPVSSRFLVLQGAPIKEQVESYGPFVMNTREEIHQTYADFQETRFGGWPWERHDQVHGPDRGRFAHYSDGTEELPPSVD